MRHLRLLLCSMGILAAISCVCFAADVSLKSLLEEMTDWTAIAKFPEPSYTAKQASSYDRASVSPDQPGWFANLDRAQYVRDETHDGRVEHVLMDEKGPGAIVRWWITAPHYDNATFRIYFDGEENPSITAGVADLVGGDFLVGAPLSEERSKGKNLYLPIPYAKSCKITVDSDPEKHHLFYQIVYRTYADGTNVETFSMEQLKQLGDLVAETQKILLQKNVIPSDLKEAKNILKANEKERRVYDRSGEPGSLFFQMKLEAEDLPQALRSTLLHISFDGKETVCCPVGDFFGSGVGINPYKSWYTAVSKGGWMSSRWPMPYRSKVEIKLTNLTDQEIKYSLWVSPYNWTWDDRSMYFHVNWRQEREILTVAGDGTKDFNYIEIQGKGVFAGDSLTVLNRYKTWWGEGDEKIYVDGEKFPSHFGTGTEDYYGYAWGWQDFFDGPFHAQPRVEGPDWHGYTTNSRYRILDGIPFTKDFKFDIEVWHWAKTKIDYSVVTYWYALGDATTNQPGNFKEEAAHKVSYHNEFVFDLPGYEIVNKPKGTLSIQNLGIHGNFWLNDEQLWWTNAKPGDELVLKVKTEHTGKQKFVVSMTKARDYGIVQFWLDGQKLGNPIDLFNADKVIHSGPIELGTVDIPVGDHELRITIEGKNEKSVDFMFGMDKYEFLQ